MVIPVVVKEDGRITVELCNEQQKPYAIAEFKTDQAF